MDEYKGSAFSVGISVLSSPNDAKLSWPFRGQFTVTLLNQVKNNNHHFMTLGVCKEFISHKDLFEVSSTRRYQADGIVYMQVQYLDKN